MKQLMLSLLVGVAMTGALMLIEYQYCMDGSGRGWPFAVIHPAHSPLVPGAKPPTQGDEPFSILLRSDVRYPPELNVLALVGDIVVWSAVAFFVLQGLAKRRSRSTPSEEIHRVHRQ